MPSRLSMVLLLAACASPAPLRTVRAPAAPDVAEIASWLPPRADRCVVVRPGRVPARRRTLLLRQSWAADVWDADLAVTAYARAEATLRDTRRATRAYFRFAGTLSQARERARTLAVRWAGEPCTGLACRRPVARWVDERTLEVARHEWPTSATLPIATRSCVELARSDDTAEVGVRPLIMASHVGLQLQRTLAADASGLEIRVVVRFGSEAAAERGAAAIRLAPPIWQTLQPLSASERVVTLRGRSVHGRELHTWTDLEMVREDDRLRIAAAARSRERSEPVPIDRVDVHRLPIVRHQERLRQAELERHRGPGRRELAEALGRLLERAHEAHPSELWIAAHLARLELDELERPERVVQLADAVLASELARDPQLWRVLRREALASGEPAAFAAALLEDGIADDASEASRAAADLVQLRSDGVAYEWAEGAWVLSRALPTLLPMAQARGLLSRAGTISALLALARLTDPSAGGTVQIAIVTAEALAPRAVGVSGPELIVLRAPRSGAVLVAALPTHSLVEMRRLALRIGSVLGVGPISIVVQLRSPSGGASHRVRVDGTLQADTFELSRVSRHLSGTDFDDVQRYLAQPLAELSPALFPPPELTLRAQSPEEAGVLARASSAHSPTRCESAGPMVRCRSPGDPNALGELLLELARSRVDGLLQPAP